LLVPLVLTSFFFSIIRIKLDTTDIIVGIKVEVGEPDPNTPNWGRFQVSVEWYHRLFEFTRKYFCFFGAGIEKVVLHPLFCAVLPVHHLNLKDEEVKS
jgi:hypothetical protein